MRTVWYAIVAVVVVAPVAFGGPADSTANRSARDVIAHDAHEFIRISGRVVTAPLRWDGRDFCRAGAALGLTGGAFLLDDEALDLANRNRNGINDHLSDIAVQYGEGLNIIILTGGAYALSLWIGDDWLHETAFLTGTAVLLSSVAGRILKPLTGRARPFVGLGNAEFRPVRFDNDFNSFPSGHTIAAFALSTVLSEQIGNTWASIGLYAAAGACAFSRVYSRDHWFSDTVFGAITAVSIAETVVHSKEKSGDGSDETGWHIAPAGTGLTVTYVFP